MDGEYLLCAGDILRFVFFESFVFLKVLFF